MTEKEKSDILAVLTGIMALDIVGVAGEVYPDGDLQLVIVGELNLPEAILLIKRSVKQLTSELRTDSWKFLPSNMVDASQRSISLASIVGTIFSTLNNKSNFENLSSSLVLLIRYEMQFGFWERSKTRVHNPNDLGIAKQQNEANILAQSLTKSIEQNEEIRQQLNKNIRELEEFTIQKEQQFSNLDKTLELASQSLTEVRNSEKEASTSNGKISTLLDQTDKTLEISRKKIGQDRKTFNELEQKLTLLATQSTDQIKQLTNQSQTFNKLVSSATEKEKHILDQEEQIMRLIGHAADGRLATAFNDRERALSSRVDWWRNASIGVVIVTICWVIFIFYNNPSQDENRINWLILLTNVVRTSPAFFLLFFCQAQYTKERNIQEEYAFKAAVSRTVTSYADMIGTGEINERVKMLIETIQRIYVPPVLGKPLKPFSIRSKDFAQAAKSMAETAQSLKTTVAEALPSLKPDSKSEKT